MTRSKHHLLGWLRPSGNQPHQHPSHPGGNQPRLRQHPPGNQPTGRSSPQRPAVGSDDGSTIPLILGFFLIGLLVVAGAVMASDAYTKQRDLQSICDGAALAAANAVNSQRARTEPLTGALPLAGVQLAAESYLSRDPDRAAVQIHAGLTADGQTVRADCARHVRLAFGAAIGRAQGVDQHATASARSVLG